MVKAADPDRVQQQKGEDAMREGDPQRAVIPCLYTSYTRLPTSLSIPTPSHGDHGLGNASNDTTPGSPHRAGTLTRPPRSLPPQPACASLPHQSSAPAPRLRHLLGSSQSGLTRAANAISLARYFSTVSCAADSMFTGGTPLGSSDVGTAIFLQTAIAWRASDMRLVSIQMV